MKTLTQEDLKHIAFDNDYRLRVLEMMFRNIGNDALADQVVKERLKAAELYKDYLSTTDELKKVA